MYTTTAGTACPGLNDYQRLAIGQTPDVEKEALLRHLETCDSCARCLTALPEPDTLVDLVRQARTLGDAASEQTISHLIERLSKLRPDADQTPAPPGDTLAPSLILKCSGCGKTLKVVAEAAGKNVKCPGCQGVTMVPARKPITPTHVPSTRAGTGVGAPLAKQVMDRLDDAVKKKAYAFLAPPQAPDEIGRLGPYRVLKVLGAGGMGVVFLAEDPQLARLVALKAMLPAVAASESARERFLREARAAASLKHDNIVAIYQVGEDRDTPFLAMEFLEGEPLDAFLKRKSNLPLADVLRIGRDIALGLAAAHKRGLIHRDIKPANLWLEAETGRIKILDFGLARAVGKEAQLTQSGAIVGTPAYMAPEQGKGKTVDHRCDLFSLGCVLYQMATGAAPFHGSDLISTLMAVATENPTPPIEHDPGLPPALSELIMNLLAKTPAARPASALAVAETLDRLTREGATLPAPSNTTTVTMPNCSTTIVLPNPAARRRRSMAFAAVALLLLLPLGYWLSGVIVRIRTPDGVLIVNVDEPNAVVYVDGDKAIVTWDEGRKKAEIRVKPGTEKVQVKVMKDGYEIVSQEVNLEEKGRTIFNAKLVRNAPPMKLADEPVAKGEAATPPKHVTNSLGMKFAWIPPGTFMMGSPKEEEGRKLNETQHKVTLTKGFYMGVYTVTQEQWQEIMGNNPSQFNGEKNLPVEKVSWEDCQKFIEKLRTKDKKAYRLPTESEWEYACRAGTTTPFHFGQTISSDYQVNCFGSVLYGNGPKGISRSKTTPVGSFPANAWRLHDMHGNVWQWCQDWFGDYPQTHVVDPQGPDTGKERVLRGGALDNPFWACRSAFRLGNVPGIRGTCAGFRVCFSLDKTEAASATDGFVPLFNGKDLTGWHVANGGDARQWAVEDNAITGRSADWRTQSYLLTNRDYADFTLRLEFMVDANSGGGVVIRGLDGDKFLPLVKVTDPVKYGDYSSGTTHFVKDDKEHTRPTEDLKLAAGAWYSLEITVRGESCTAVLAVKKVVDIRLEPATGDKTVPALKRSKGKIGFQAQSGTVRYRRIEIKELPPTKAETAPAADGFVPLFNGKDLTGWYVESGDAAQWKIENEAIVGRSTDPGRRSCLLSTKEYADFALSLEYMTDLGGAGGVVIRAVDGEKLAGEKFTGDRIPDHPTIKITDPVKFGNYSSGTTHWVKNDKMGTSPIEDLKLPAGVWHSMEIVVHGDTCVAILAGKKIVDLRLDAAPGNSVVPALRRVKGKIGFQANTGTVRYRRVQIKELPPTKAEASPPKAAPIDAAWLKSVAALSPVKQVKAVSDKLKDCNPTFDGKITSYKVNDDDVVTELQFFTENVTDISPVRALTGLRVLHCIGSFQKKGQLTDLSPLKGMKLAEFRCFATKVSDLSPLEGMPLTWLDVTASNVTDLSPLEGMPLTALTFNITAVSNLSPLKGMPLEHLNCYETRIFLVSYLRCTAG